MLPIFFLVDRRKTIVPPTKVNTNFDITRPTILNLFKSNDANFNTNIYIIIVKKQDEFLVRASLTNELLGGCSVQIKNIIGHVF